jgi:hypothetical protein
MEIPEWMWRSFQKLSGTKIPATHVRNVLSEYLLGKDEKLADNMVEDDEPFEDEVEDNTLTLKDKPSPKDSGTLFTTSRNQMCVLCNRTLMNASPAVIFTAMNDKKYVVHPKCWDELI